MQWKDVYKTAFLARGLLKLMQHTASHATTAGVSVASVHGLAQLYHPAAAAVLPLPPEAHTRHAHTTSPHLHPLGGIGVLSAVFQQVEVQGRAVDRPCGFT